MELINVNPTKKVCLAAMWVLLVSKNWIMKGLKS